MRVLEAILPTLATKSDAAEMRLGFSELRGDVKSSVSELRADLHKADSAHKTWILATVLAVIGSSIAVVTLLRNPPPPSLPVQAQQPIIINNIPPQQQQVVPATPTPEKRR